MNENFVKRYFLYAISYLMCSPHAFCTNNYSTRYARCGNCIYISTNLLTLFLVRSFVKRKFLFLLTIFFVLFWNGDKYFICLNHVHEHLIQTAFLNEINRNVWIMNKWAADKINEFNAKSKYFLVSQCDYNKLMLSQNRI